ncbi:MAG: dTDP-4-dehydrorhamnose reductase [Candidatus Jettenia sp.]|uniref:dTDP-4-dehydrorhamnose reductase n=1 Tax=Candidatus Jettenia caeni TaxID=247490 RepID=I3IKP6_9BACT|nr:dTDP-4-dehydrorhamnose reductase [Candidatus Jettenia sp. AMX1]MBC6929651.1 dTDP-4-dehydrorhamnose reductase [Candidatus Jettenia sp.]NUN22887.1 dTDP-4-dehydrorhamnose reductase [Candidatus Jettenia caeni]KAA0249052.1 MAG: dTDP-4-dehydrorhamnose reductase [Candidatus Jettenia sp. AMX1]MCE7881200.1 dTDP-4-dehydrorhamnose reductase [Candidatus Jettenia sp. AMX1]MCQ3927845.1 dTDP-4-dehydrorhamnose reductase [Candidatus Jettenia sp.]
MKILVIGSDGMLGRYLVNYLSNLSHSKSISEVIGVNHKQVDITHHSDTSRLIAHIRPNTIINCAAFTNVDACETQIPVAFAVNAAGAKNIALAAKHAEAKVIQISTDYVFDGTKNEPYIETDQTNPISVYGKSKLAGELAIQEILDNYIIIRTAWLFGPWRRNFVTTMLDLGKKNRSVSVVTDQYGSPTYTANLSHAIGTMISLDLRGLYHITNSGTCSRYEWAKKIFELTDSSVSVLPVKTADYKRAAMVPQNSSLNCTKYTQDSGQTMKPWQEALKEYLDKNL